MDPLIQNTMHILYGDGAASYIIWEMFNGIVERNFFINSQDQPLSENRLQDKKNDPSIVSGLKIFFRIDYQT